VSSLSLTHNCKFCLFLFSLSLCSWLLRTLCTAFLSNSLSMKSWRHSKPWLATRALGPWWRLWTQSSSGSSRSSFRASESHLHLFTSTQTSLPNATLLYHVWKCIEQANDQPDVWTPNLYPCYALSISKPSLVNFPQLTIPAPFSVLCFPLHLF